MKEDRQEFGLYLRRLRKECGYSQEYVASKLNIRRQTYSHYETGRINPPVKAICIMAGLYHVSSDKLLGIFTGTEETGEDSMFRYLDRDESNLIFYFDNLDHKGRKLAMKILEEMYKRERE